MSASIRDLFDGIAHRYDFLNHFLSAGRDKVWRKRAVAALNGKGAKDAATILDLCGGTGDFWKAWADARLAHSRPAGGWGVIADFSLPMLREARRKFAARNDGASGPAAYPGVAPAFVIMDALHPAFKDASFDAVLCGYGMRNLDSTEGGMQQVRRLLKPEGRFVTLEFFRPTKLFTHFFYQILAPLCIPLLGALFSSRRRAYVYLVKSVQGFCSVTEYGDSLRKTGYTDVAVFSCDFGVSHIVTAVKG